MGNWEKNISVKETACTKALRLEHIHTQDSERADGTGVEQGKEGWQQMRPER